MSAAVDYSSATIHVGTHAIERFASRCGASDWPYVEIARFIRTDIRAAIYLDRVTETRPRWAVGDFDGTGRRELDEGRFGVWHGENGKRRFYVVRPSGRNTLVVVSVYREGT